MTAITRPLNKLEQYTSYRHNFKQYFAVAFAGVYLPTGLDPSSSENVPFDKARLYAPVAKLVSEHPSLALIIKNESRLDVPHEFELLLELDVSRNIIYSPVVTEKEPSIEDLKKSAIELDSIDSNPVILKTISDRLSIQFDLIDEIPPWRLIVSPAKLTSKDGTITYGSHIIFAFHHSLADGTSGKLFLNALLEVLNNQYQDKTVSESSIAKLPLTTLIPPPLEETMPLPTSFRRITTALLQDMGWLPAFKHWSGAPVLDTISKNAVGIDQYRIQVKILRVSAQNAATLLSKAREHKVSITSLISSIGVVALHLTLKRWYGNSSGLPKKEQYPGNFEGLQCSIPKNLRPIMKKHKADTKFTFLPFLEDAMGVYVCSIDHNLSISFIEPILLANKDNTEEAEKSAVWETAKQIKQTINDHAKTDNKNLDTGLLKYISSFPKFFKKKVGGKRKGSIEVSSIMAGPDKSVSTVPKDGSSTSAIAATAGTPERPYALKNLLFAQTASGATAPINVSLISFKSGDMCISFSWVTASVEAKFVDYFEAKFQELLNNALK